MLSSGRTVSYRSKLYCRVRCDFIVHYVYIERYYSIASYTKANTILYYTFIHSFVHSFIHSYPSFMSFNFMSFVQSYMIFNIYKVNLIESQIKKTNQETQFWNNTKCLNAEWQTRSRIHGLVRSQSWGETPWLIAFTVFVLVVFILYNRQEWKP